MLVNQEIGGGTSTTQVEDYLAGRYTRKPRRVSKELVYEFTRDPGYLHQYYLLREKMYIRTWGLKNFEAPEDEYDRQSHIIIARRGNHVVGGGRLTVAGPRKETLLPLEDEDFRLKDLFPEMGLEYCKYAELSRMAVEPEFHGGECTKALFEHMYRKLSALKVAYWFALAPSPSARMYRRMFNSLGLDLTIWRETEVPQRDGYEGIKMNLLSVSIMDTNQQEANSKKTADNAGILSVS